MNFAIVHGPNLNWLGKREPKLYGSQTWEEIWAELNQWAEPQKIGLSYFQSNHEGALIDKLQQLDDDSKTDGILLNPAALTHTSLALGDCAASLTTPVVEVHFTNIYRRESFRQSSTIAEACQASIFGFGPSGYLLGLDFLSYLVQCPR